LSESEESKVMKLRGLTLLGVAAVALAATAVASAHGICSQPLHAAN
jgi:hypothetical protein